MDEAPGTGGEDGGRAADVDLPEAGDGQVPDGDEPGGVDDDEVLADEVRERGVEGGAVGDVGVAAAEAGACGGVDEGGGEELLAGQGEGANRPAVVEEGSDDGGAEVPGSAGAT